MNTNIFINLLHSFNLGKNLFTQIGEDTDFLFQMLREKMSAKVAAEIWSLKLLILFHGKRWRGETERTHESFVLACCGASKRRSMHNCTMYLLT